MKLSKHNDNYQIAKDIQHLSDCMDVQNQINTNVSKSIHAAGWGLILLSAAGYLVIDMISKIEKRVKALEDAKKVTEEVED